MTYGINPEYSFKNFVNGRFNQFSQAVALTVAHHPGTTYNPLYIYGGEGWGKTHLVHAIGNEIRSRKEWLQICCIASEKLAHEFKKSLRQSRMVEFRDKIKSFDVLLIDDIQTLAGTKDLLEEVIHLLWSICDAGRQVVITSDRPPFRFQGAHEKLLEFLVSGLVADIQSPDLEARLAILNAKADQNDMELPEDVSFF